MRRGDTALGWHPPHPLQSPIQHTSVLCLTMCQLSFGEGTGQGTKNGNPSGSLPGERDWL